MKKIVYFFSKLGITKNERVVLISRLPQVFSMSLEKNLMAKFSYFCRTLNWSSRPEHVASGAVAVAEGQDLGKAPISGPEGTLRQGLQEEAVAPRDRRRLCGDEVRAGRVQEVSEEVCEKYQGEGAYRKKPTGTRPRGGREEK